MPHRQSANSSQKTCPWHTKNKPGVFLTPPPEETLSRIELASKRTDLICWRGGCLLRRTLLQMALTARQLLHLSCALCNHSIVKNKVGRCLCLALVGLRRHLPQRSIEPSQHKPAGWLAGGAAPPQHKKGRCCAPLLSSPLCLLLAKELSHSRMRVRPAGGCKQVRKNPPNCAACCFLHFSQQHDGQTEQRTPASTHLTMNAIFTASLHSALAPMDSAKAIASWNASFVSKQS